MNKSTKGAWAAGTAAVLLLGGAGSLAYWSSSDDATGGTINSGSLNLTLDSCDSDWTLDSVGGTGGALAGRLVVPGDTLTKVCTFNYVSTGAHLVSDLTVGTPTFNASSDAELAAALQIDATYKIDADPAVSGDPIPAGNHTITANIKVTFPFDGVATPEDNNTQDQTAVLDAITVTATQTDNH